MNGNDEFEGRLKVLGILAVLVISVLIVRVGYLHVYDGEYYARLADGNRIRLIPSVAPRGTFLTGMDSLWLSTDRALPYRCCLLRRLFLRT